MFMMNLFYLALFLNVVLVNCYKESQVTRDVRKDRELSEDDMRIDNIMHSLQGVCLKDNPSMTVKQLKKDTEHILKNIAEYKDIVKMNKKLRDEIKWIVEESKGPKEVSRIISLLKRDMEGVCRPRYKDCNDIKTRKSGVYTIYPDKGKGVKVYCDLETDGGGWTVIQRKHGNGKVNFKRNWNEYENGFGDLNTDFWLGNKYIHEMTYNSRYVLRINMVDTSNNKQYAVYKTFIVGDAGSKYKLTVGDYHGNAGDRLKDHNGYKFSTPDQDNDVHSTNCASAYGGGWWYKGCFSCDLNGAVQHKNLYWKSYSVSKSVMMIRKM